MYNNEILKSIPPMLTGEKLKTALTAMPQYDEKIVFENETVRLMELSNLYKIYLPSEMSVEIYSKLYLALIHSLNKKIGKNAVRQQNENYKIICGRENSGIIGGADSFTIIGASGIGKSSAINKAIELICRNGVIETSQPQSKIIPCIVVQCPFDSSVKGLLIEILRKADEVLNSSYYANALKSRATTDMLIGSVSQVALNHIGLLIVDEIQNVTNSKNGKALIGTLTQLINNSGISICMVGTPECKMFFESAMQLARRSLGLQYSALEYNQYFYDFCTRLFEYQYVKNKREISDPVIEWLYEHSAGVISVVISLIHDAQEISILNGREVLDIASLNEAYDKRLAMLHEYIEPSIKKRSQTAKTKKTLCVDINPNLSETDNYTVMHIVSNAKGSEKDVVKVLKKYITVEEIKV